MFHTERPHVELALQDERKLKLYRMAHEPSWLERLAALVWIPTSALLNAAGYGLIAAGRALLTLTRKAKKAKSQPAIMPLDTRQLTS